MYGLTLFTRDPDAAADFYTALGAQTVEDGGTWECWFGDQHIILCPAGDRAPSRVCLGIDVPDLTDAWNAMEAMGIDVSLSCAGIITVTDPDGNRVTLREPC